MLVYGIVREDKNTGAVLWVYHTAWADEKLAIKEARLWNKINTDRDTFYRTHSIHVEA